MTKIFTILFASGALAVGAGLPALSAMYGELRPQVSREATADASNAGAKPLFASDVGRIDLDHGRRLGRDDSDDGSEDDADDDDDENDGYEGSAAAGPAPVGTVAPAGIGLFGSGAAPKVKVN